MPETNPALHEYHDRLYRITSVTPRGMIYFQGEVRILLAPLRIKRSPDGWMIRTEVLQSVAYHTEAIHFAEVLEIAGPWAVQYSDNMNPIDIWVEDRVGEGENSNG